MVFLKLPVSLLIYLSVYCTFFLITPLSPGTGTTYTLLRARVKPTKARFLSSIAEECFGGSQSKSITFSHSKPFDEWYVPMKFWIVELKISGD